MNTFCAMLPTSRTHTSAKEQEELSSLGINLAIIQALLRKKLRHKENQNICTKFKARVLILRFTHFEGVHEYISGSL